MIKVLIVDDSTVYRSLIRRALSDEKGIEIVGSASNGENALAEIERLKPDVLTLDFEMPQLDGLGVLEHIKAKKNKNLNYKNLNVIMVSSHTFHGAQMTIKALNLGAIDFVAKPQCEDADESFLELKKKIIPKIKAIGTKYVLKSVDVVDSIDRKAPSYDKVPRVLLIGSSTGGPQALSKILPEISLNISLPIVIIQHMPPVFTKSLAETLDKACSYKALEVSEVTELKERHIYIAPGGLHMTLFKAGKKIQLRLNQQPPENFCRPSIDVLFRSAAQVFGAEAVALILTGMGSDGTQGLKPLKRKGAYVIAQDEATSVVWGMPGNAVQENLVDTVLPLEEIGEKVIGLCKK